MNSTKLASAPRPAPWYSHRWPWLLMAGPAIVVVAGTFTMWLAFTRQDALVADDYYERGKAINLDLRRDRAATQLGLSAQLRYDAARGMLIGSVAGAALPPAGVLVIRLAHPTLPNKDVTLRATLGVEGSFAVPLPMLERAHWSVMIENESRQWRLARGWNWPAKSAIDFEADPGISR